MALIVQGYANIWGDEAEVDGHRERIAPGAFQHARHTSLRLAHGSVGAALSWRCRVCEDDLGLRFECELDPTNAAHRQIAAAVRYEGLDRVSLGFRSLRSRWEGRRDLEVIEQARLLELSLTSDAAYSSAYAEVVDGELPAPEPLRIDPWFAAQQQARREGKLLPIVFADPPRDSADEPDELVYDGPSCGIPQAMAGLRDPVQFAVRRHIAGYLSRMPL